MFAYEINAAMIELKEAESADGQEYTVHCLTPEAAERLEKVRFFFEHNKILTDVLFYNFPDHRFSVLVRPEYTAEFLGEMFKQKLLISVRWN